MIGIKLDPVTEIRTIQVVPNGCDLQEDLEEEIDSVKAELEELNITH